MAVDQHPVLGGSLKRLGGVPVRMDPLHDTFQAVDGAIYLDTLSKRLTTLTMRCSARFNFRGNETRIYLARLKAYEKESTIQGQEGNPKGHISLWNANFLVDDEASIVRGHFVTNNAKSHFNTIPDGYYSRQPFVTGTQLSRAHGACVATLNDEQHSIKVKFYDVVEPHLLQQICLVQLFEAFAQTDNCQQLFSPDEFLPFEEYGPLCEETNPESWTTSLELQFQNARCCPLELYNMARKPLREAALQVTLRRINSNYYLIKHKWLYWKLYYLTKPYAPPAQGTEMPFLKVKEAKDPTAVLESNLKTARKCDVNAGNPSHYKDYLDEVSDDECHNLRGISKLFTHQHTLAANLLLEKEITDTHHGR
ncbi:unnamed protein product [Fusarium fujikuroi]|uniref:Uncharacterized protein n=1 Tax=Fusarium fujikuroi TaxID=5127 RepID=A0A9Q9RVH1_FUSFU|nr:unnamed protein product [Fusarium fujikuroi]